VRIISTQKKEKKNKWKLCKMDHLECVGDMQNSFISTDISVYAMGVFFAVSIHVSTMASNDKFMEAWKVAIIND